MSMDTTSQFDIVPVRTDSRRDRIPRPAEASARPRWHLLTALVPYQALRRQRVPGTTRQSSFGRLSALDEHLAMLAREFAGASQLEYLMACTIVMLRRGIEVPKHLARFRRLWFWHGRFLRTRLDSRWLISAADTFVDFPRSSTEQACAMAAVLLGSTVKLYETERLMTRASSGDSGQRIGRWPRNQELPAALFDGLTSYQVGCGDMLKNLEVRFERVVRQRGPAPAILGELMNRMKTHDSIFSRFH